jgi:Tol biopolymer transport system component/DNA-binding winged helix-turn-helix (wHTH) protein
MYETQSRLVRFGAFEADVRTGELRKHGVKLKFSGQPFQVLAILLERPGDVVTREELQKRLWPDTFVDVERNLNTAVNKIREVLGDSSENPTFVETLPRRGYRFIQPVENPNREEDVSRQDIKNEGTTAADPRSKSTAKFLAYAIALSVVAFATIALFLIYTRPHTPVSSLHSLIRVTFDAGLQLSPTWSPDGRLIAYASDRGGKVDIWIQQVSGGEPVRVTHTPGNNWQPSWSPDGKYIAYRSEAGTGLFVIPALGSEGPGRRITSFGYRPQWSPDGSEILFQTLTGLSTPRDTFYVVGLDGGLPKPILPEFLAQHPGSIAWHPDGKNIVVWERQWNVGKSSPNLWTVPLSGGAATHWEVGTDIAHEFQVVSGTKPICDVGDNLSWAPSGNAVFFACEYRGATNVWKLSLDPNTVRATGVERLTAGPGPDEGPAVSPDGKRIAFAAKSERVRVWLLPFDSNAGRVLGTGSPVTSLGYQAYEPSLSPDGKKLAYAVLRGGRWEIWGKLLPDGQESPLITGDYDFEFPQWSRDGKQLVYRRIRTLSGPPEVQFVLWSEQTRTEEQLTHDRWGAPYDWWLDDGSVLVSSFNPRDGSAEVQRLWLGKAPGSEEFAQTIASQPGSSLWQAHISPDGQWIVFMGVGPRPAHDQSTIYVMPSKGGTWVPVTDGNHWSDKPRWSPDGKVIYYISEKNGFSNVWGIRFDPSLEKVLGQPFQLTLFETPSLMFPTLIEPSDISIAPGRLALTLQDTSGSIWILDNVDR